MNFLSDLSSALPNEINFEDIYTLVSDEFWKKNPKTAAIQALRRSGKFDCEDYIERYIDVKNSRIDPIYHYIMYGMYEDRYFSCIDKNNLINIRKYKQFKKQTLNNTNKNICIIVNELTYTGAPYSSLRIATCLCNMYNIEIVSPVEGNFKYAILNSGFNLKIIQPNHINSEENIKYFKKFDLIIANGIATSEFVNITKNIVPTVWFIREAYNIVDYSIKRQNLLKNYPFCISVSEYAASYIRKNYTPYVHVLNNFVDDCYLNNSNNKHIGKKIKFLFCGTLSKRKGLDIIINAIENLKIEYKEKIELHIVGRKIEVFKSFWEPLLDKLNYNWIIDHGEITDKNKMINLYSKIDMVVIPSRDESFSNVLLESMMMGKGAIISENVGAKEITNNKSVIIFKNEDANELKEKIQYIIENKNIIHDMGCNARNVYLKRGTRNIYQEKLLNIINFHLSIHKKNVKYNFKSYIDLISDLKNKVKILKEHNITEVLGIPRSGMVPAYIIGNLLNIPVKIIDENQQGDFTHRKLQYKDGNTLVIDDSVLSGRTINQVRKKNFDKNYLYSAVYSTNQSSSHIDIILSNLEAPRIFEWNYLNHPHCKYWGYDIDGVLCEDPSEEENDDGDKYINFILNAKPLYIPSYHIGAIITSRLEKYRKYTELWLKQHNVKYYYLIMLDLPSKKERIKLNCHAQSKAYHYKNLDHLTLYIESNMQQANAIAQISRKQVMCVENNKLYNPKY